MYEVVSQYTCAALYDPRVGCIGAIPHDFGVKYVGGVMVMAGCDANHTQGSLTAGCVDYIPSGLSAGCEGYRGVGVLAGCGTG